MSTSGDSVTRAELRKQLFRALDERTEDPEVQRRLAAAVREIRLIEGVGTRPVGTVRAKDTLVDLLLRLLGIGDDEDKPATLGQPLSEQQTRATWVARQVVEDEEDGDPTSDVLPNYVVSENSAAKEQLFIGWKATEDDLELLGLQPDGFLDDPITNVDLKPLEPPSAEEGMLVSFTHADAVEDAIEREREDVGEFYTQPSYPSFEEDDGEDDFDDDFGADPAESVVESEEEPEPSPEPSPEPHAPAVAEKRGVASTPMPVPSDAVPGSSRSARTPVPSIRPPVERQGAEADEQRLLMQRNLGLFFAIGGVLIALVVAGVGFAAYQGSVMVNRAARHADGQAGAMFDRVVGDPSYISGMGALGGDERRLSDGWHSVKDATTEERTRRVLGFAMAVEREWEHLRGVGGKYLQVSEKVKRITLAKEDYMASVEAWADSANQPLGRLATGLGLARRPDAKALMPLE